MTDDVVNRRAGYGEVVRKLALALADGKGRSARELAAATGATKAQVVTTISNWKAVFDRTKRGVYVLSKYGRERFRVAVPEVTS